MSIAYVLYNPYSDNNTGKEKAENVRKVYDKEVVMTDITAITSYADFFGAIAPEDEIIVSGGDGTLNRFINDTDGLDVTNDVLYFATGTGNDFLRDMEKQVGCAPFSVKEVIRDLPIVTVKGKDYRFINGVGFGIDGYCCEVGDKIREKTPGKPINYTAIAIKGLLFHYKPANAKVTVDGVEHSFKKVWIAPTMVGRYYGGGMMPAPGQRREDRLDHVSVSLMYHAGKLGTLMSFPNLFKGQHLKKEKSTAVFAGKEIKVEFDRPTALQIDGETILDVTSYQVRLAQTASPKAPVAVATV